jgi:hypothetical protein
MENQKKNILFISALSIIIIIIVILTVTVYSITYGNNKTRLKYSTAEINITSKEEGYELDIIDITLSPDQEKWLELEEVIYLLSPRPLPMYGDEHFPLDSEGGTTEEYFKALIADKENPYNIVSGKLNEITQNPNNDIIYNDKDNNLLISINDSILINYSLIPRNLTSEEFLFKLIYIGDLDGSLSREVFIFINEIVIERLE